MADIQNLRILGIHFLEDDRQRKTVVAEEGDFSELVVGPPEALVMGRRPGANALRWKLDRKSVV